MKYEAMATIVLVHGNIIRPIYCLPHKAKYKLCHFFLSFEYFEKCFQFMAIVFKWRDSTKNHGCFVFMAT
jgi:hypothetical protein